MRIGLLLTLSILLCGCVPTEDPVAQAPLAQASTQTCAKAFGAIASGHSIPNTDAAFAAATYTCEYARTETWALSLCESPFPTHSLLRDPLGAADYRLRKRTLSAMMDAELFGEGLAKKLEAERIANGGTPKTEEGCAILFKDFELLLTQREGALRALSLTGG